MDPYSIVKYPLNTEKSIRLMESQNKLIFRVETSAEKPQIKKAIEELFKVKVVAVNTFFSPSGEKRAYVTFAKESPAINIATQMGLM